MMAHKPSFFLPFLFPDPPPHPPSAQDLEEPPIKRPRVVPSSAPAPAAPAAAAAAAAATAAAAAASAENITKLQTNLVQLVQHQNSYKTAIILP